MKLEKEPPIQRVITEKLLSSARPFDQRNYIVTE